MKRIAFLAVCGLLACGDDQAPDQAAELWSRIQNVGYRSFVRPPGFEQRVASSAPHGDNVEVFMNDVAAEVLRNAAPTEAWPDGTLFVKDGYEDDGALDVVTAMEKRDGAWFWAEWNASGESIYSGTPEVCTDCHGSGRDFTRGVALP